MIVYAPRKVTLAPREPQAIRIAARAAAGPAQRRISRAPAISGDPARHSGRWRGSEEQPKGVQFKLTPVYGVTIPVIVRLGNLQASRPPDLAKSQLGRKKALTRGQPLSSIVGSARGRGHARPMARSACSRPA